MTRPVSASIVDALETVHVVSGEKFEAFLLTLRMLFGCGSLIALLCAPLQQRGQPYERGVERFGLPELAWHGRHRQSQSKPGGGLLRPLIRLKATGNALDLVLLSRNSHARSNAREGQGEGPQGEGRTGQRAP